VRLTIHVDMRCHREGTSRRIIALSFTGTPPEILPQGVVQLATTSHMKTPAAVAGSMPGTLIQLLSRVGTVALARATFGLLICVALALTSPSGIAGLLPAITSAYAVVGTLAFGRAVREEMHKDLANAASLYVLALMYWFMSYVSLLASSL
jgi:hypothetical protein